MTERGETEYTITIHDMHTRLKPFFQHYEDNFRFIHEMQDAIRFKTKEPQLYRENMVRELHYYAELFQRMQQKTIWPQAISRLRGIVSKPNFTPYTDMRLTAKGLYYCLMPEYLAEISEKLFIPEDRRDFFWRHLTFYIGHRVQYEFQQPPQRRASQFFPSLADLDLSSVTNEVERSKLLVAIFTRGRQPEVSTERYLSHLVQTGLCDGQVLEHWYNSTMSSYVGTWQNLVGSDYKKSEASLLFQTVSTGSYGSPEG